MTTEITSILESLSRKCFGYGVKFARGKTNIGHSQSQYDCTERKEARDWAIAKIEALSKPKTE